MKRAACGLGVTVLVLLLSAGDASAAGPWDHSGGTDGRFATAMEACKDQYGTPYAYEVVDAVPPNGDAKGNSTCMVREKGNASAAKLPNGIVYKVAGQPPPPAAPTPCDANSDLSWFPSVEGSRLAKAAKGPAGDVVSRAEVGTCDPATVSAGTKLFANSQGSRPQLKPDRMVKNYKLTDKGGSSNHYHLTTDGLIVDPTIFQFFNTKNGFDGKVFVGDERQLKSTLNRLVKQCGTSEDPRVKDLLAGKSGTQLYDQLWGGATVKNAGSTLKMRGRGNGADYEGYGK